MTIEQRNYELGQTLGQLATALTGVCGPAGVIIMTTATLALAKPAMEGDPRSLGAFVAMGTATAKEIPGVLQALAVRSDTSTPVPGIVPGMIFAPR